MSEPTIPVGTNPFLKQEGGNHYSKMPLQPILFATMNNYDPAAFSILKYLSRFRSKDGLKDLRKAAHFVELREAMIVSGDVVALTPPVKITMGRYVTLNNITNSERIALLKLEEWVCGCEDYGAFTHPERLMVFIQHLISNFDGS